MPPLVSLFWILKKAKATPKITVQITRTPMPWTISCLKPRLVS